LISGGPENSRLPAVRLLIPTESPEISNEVAKNWRLSKPIPKDEDEATPPIFEKLKREGKMEHSISLFITLAKNKTKEKQNKTKMRYCNSKQAT